MTAPVESARMSSALQAGVCYAQSEWRARPVAERLRFVPALRRLLAENGEKLAAAAALKMARPLAEKLVSEVLPLVEACRWLERHAATILASRWDGGRGRPFWLYGIDTEVQRQPFGVVLVIGPGNYPLFLPAVHALQALVAGNAVRLKPAPGASEVALVFARLATEAGLDSALIEVLDDTVDAAREAIIAGVDKVVFTGSSQNGRTVLAQLAPYGIPAVMELSGEDPVVVLADADLDLVVRALRFGRTLNGGDTCMAPHRLIVVERVADQLASKLDESIALPMDRVRDDAEAIARVNQSEFGLGASIFSRDVRNARKMAAALRTGFVLINDIIVPTADPRLTFGGIKRSGFGSTRGPEGLLEMTFPHVIAVRAGRSHPHLEESRPDDARLFSAAIRAAHGRKRFAAFVELFRVLTGRIKTHHRKP